MAETVMIHTVPPWAPSGYGVQARLLGLGLRDAGYNVAFSAYGGFLREEPYQGMRVMACGGSAKGVGRIAHNYKRCNADFMIIVADFWVFEPEELRGLTVVPWVPVDVTPLGVWDQLKLGQAAKLCELHPVAISKHGAAMMAEHGHEAPVIPHMLRRHYQPHSDRMAWRREHGIPEDVFLISMVGVNGDYPDRKAFDVLLCAFQAFTERQRKARLYLHTTYRNGTEGLDLLMLAKTLGIKDTIGFPDQLERRADTLGPDYMAAMYNASDVLSAASRGEGFGVPIIEALACGTPVIGSRCSSMPELIPAGAGWLADVQPQWCNLHGSWWHTPLVSSLLHRFGQAHKSAHLMRGAAAAAAARFQPHRVMPLWLDFLASIGHAP